MPNEDRPGYVGRFAPSPTGDLHFGSVVAAVASYLQARRNNGKWLVRMEDIDPPREIPGSASRILAELNRLGMRPDEPALFQSSRIAAYRKSCRGLVANKLAFHCTCSRKMLRGAEVYPGTCRNGSNTPVKPSSVRLKVDTSTVSFTDGLQGLVTEKLDKTCGDFVIWRADDLPAYQLAVVLDDAFQDVTEVVRGADLLGSTTRQLYLQTTLGLNNPAYIHIPVVTLDGRKLSKESDSDPVADQDPVSLLNLALNFLGHHPPATPDLHNLWQWALETWDVSRVPAVPAIALEQVSRIRA